MIDRKHIGLSLEPLTVTVEKGRLRFFAKATGQDDPVYTDEAAARAAGYPSLPAPPTFLFSLGFEKPDPFELLHVMDVDLARVLHGEQSFVYHKPVCAGDVVTLKSTVTDIYDKKDGALEFIVQKTDVTNEAGALVAELQQVVVVRN
ncbi:MaoC family dehydratase N-terminal domain-containing protein [Nitratireductor sp. XY-223]|uniref:MaoC family dehydratase N-terminal domain-containing protein n=1 Tax=Nitratireductor sp. XY-223 TaxID=2561926 RepID=UPI0010A9991E|nr:MaoC family dehydratase N-terminal domain-containing protein [Nitratireductor sp. XY-223]